MKVVVVEALQDGAGGASISREPNGRVEQILEAECSPWDTRDTRKQFYHFLVHVYWVPIIYDESCSTKLQVPQEYRPAPLPSMAGAVVKF